MMYKVGDLVVSSNREIEDDHLCAVWDESLHRAIDFLSPDEFAIVVEKCSKPYDWIKIATPRGKIGLVYSTDLKRQ